MIDSPNELVASLANVEQQLIEQNALIQTLVRAQQFGEMPTAMQGLQRLQREANSLRRRVARRPLS
ncbi:hypothetical protein [Acidisphaera sp. L21]|uniref:hypothetical protein n=1 Tax=Acidisphaera sp. L21 TaxID=1641851 RepID=UPI00131DE53A|nr:hypothetical protein [Acidisphaera sp. L21]